MQTPKSTVLVTTICSLLSIAMLVLVVFVFVKEHEEIMKITRTKKNALCLWSLIGIGISSVIEILLALGRPLISSSSRGYIIKAELCDNVASKLKA